MKIIRVNKLRKEFKSYERGEGFTEAVLSLFKRNVKISKAVNDIDFAIEKGEVVGFLGPNGAGKSTTIKILSGVMHPDGGSVNIMNYTPWIDRRKYVANIGVVFGQKSQLFWDLPPIDAFYMHKSIFSIDEKSFKTELDKLTKLLSIKEIMKKPTRQLSLGERMRCEFVMAMLHKPKIVFLDEPTIGLDIFAKEIIRKFIKKINNKEKTTFIVTSHDLEDIEHLCDRIIVINEGRIVFNDKTTKLKVNNKKYVTIKFYDKVNLTKIKKMKNFKVVKKLSDYSVRLEIDTSKMSLNEIIKVFDNGQKVEDIEISNPPISEIIKKLYRA
ncbi:ATP-binding cassette domain-containing protein [Candidatus Woesearchaeota archaeon]|jgi:ABC-2 type transport system ATP-binding protein|nr:ATP-binding cassette domain-containing protein [Candidatus Woesearchaeota archaeon]MBT3537420.1 ATP-binding cassette domain-containing protein [Candidatus Woesearchaeota archaeon]MBT4697779.1 ATP-binding cassette domain-containing protein [Candidatus Woesearchaeota archaeon]MBT4717534.1 ATP-binding cassette domain-containing protein [Candidatus Woesearchaeota archaeon]MBT7106270.1 ATP-binding cassette domain-containing protein [Candidatus Woesearchaeota archaeon]